MAHIVMLSQVYPPDAASVGQHFEDAAIRLADRGHIVTVYAADRDYDNPAIKYDGRSRHPGVRVVRLPFSSFGKRTLLHRLAGQGLYLGQAFFHLLFARLDGLVMTTIPATSSLVFFLLSLIRRVRVLYWVMDLNPDQAVAIGVVKADSISVRCLNALNARLYARAQRIVVMDRYMLERLQTKSCFGAEATSRTRVIAPWPLGAHQKAVPPSQNPFLSEHGLDRARCVFMYSGNHSLVHPLDTLMEATRAFRDRDDMRFVFVGGGRGKAAVEALIKTEHPTNVLSLPYQPLDQVKYSLSAADVHIVAMGEAMVGIVHPCKIYGALALGKPVLLLGPRQSHLGELIAENGIGWVVEHGDISGMKALLEAIVEMPRDELAQMGQRGEALIKEVYSGDKLAGEFCDLVEQTVLE